MITMAISVPISFAAASRFVLSQMVIDKETKMKESLKILSLKTGAYALSYFATQAIFSLMTAILITAVYAIQKYIISTMIVPFFIVCILFGFTLIFYSMVLTTMFSDSKLSTQIGSLALIMPMAFFIGIAQNDSRFLYLLYWLPHFPATVLMSQCAGANYGMNYYITWAAVVVLLPVYYGLYLYLDQIVPDTYGISKNCCFCL